MTTTLRWRSMVWATSVAVYGATAAPAAQPESPALQACARITQDSERLACFDREMAAAAVAAAGATARPAGAATGPSAAPAAAAAPATAIPSAPTMTPQVATAPQVATSPQLAPSPLPPAAAAAAPAASSAPAARPAPSAGTATAGAAAATLTPEETFGLTGDGIRKLQARQGAKAAQGQPLKELEARVAGVSRNPAGRAVLTLDNGQVWRQSETRSTFEAHAGDAVKITPGALGSYWLSTGVHNWTRVERLP